MPTTLHKRSRRGGEGREGRLDGDSQKGAAVPKKPKKLTRKELATPEGRFSVHFQALLTERGWTKDYFVGRSGIKDATVRKWLRADSVPDDFDTLQAIAKALDVPGHPFPDYRMVLPPLR